MDKRCLNEYNKGIIYFIININKVLKGHNYIQYKTII